MNVLDILFIMFSSSVLLIFTVSNEHTANALEYLDVPSLPVNFEENIENAASFVNATETQNQITVDHIGPIISQLLSPISSTIQPYLGPHLSPLSSILQQVITNTVTEIVVSILNDTVSSAKLQEASQFKNYTTYLVIIADF